MCDYFLTITFTKSLWVWVWVSVAPLARVVHCSMFLTTNSSTTTNENNTNNTHHYNNYHNNNDNNDNNNDDNDKNINRHPKKVGASLCRLFACAALQQLEQACEVYYAILEYNMID